jgi:hypothetical protein
MVWVEGFVKAVRYNVERGGWVHGRFKAVYLINITGVMQGPDEQLLAHDWKVTYNYTDVPDIAVGDGVEVYGYFRPEIEGPESSAINVGPKYPGSYIQVTHKVWSDKPT